MSISKDSLCHPMDSTPSEYQRFLPGAYANYTDQAKRDQKNYLPVDFQLTKPKLLI